jgi:RHS repeat-associated protein
MNKHMAVHIGMTCWGSQKALTPTYTHTHRLATANGAYGAQSYGYDANGNRSSATLNGVNNSYTNAADSNRLQSANGKTYTFDANGNTINDGLHTYSYDARNRLVGLNTGVSYSLNGLGQRISKSIPGIDTSNTSAGDANGDGSINAQDYSAILNHILGTPAANDADCNQDGQVNVQDLVCINIKINPALQTAGGKTLFLYDEQGQLIGEYDQTGTPIQETIYLGNLPVAVVKNNVVYRLYADHLNTPRAIADNTNKVVWGWNSDAFGTTAANEDPDGDGVKLTYNLRFPGQYLDQETGLHYNYFRDYDPGTGRYVESDPIGLDGGLNTYTYVDNNPLRYTDPLGLLQIKPSRRKDGIDAIGDLLDTKICDWWPASCLFKCVRWQCSYTDECGKTKFNYIGKGDLGYASTPGYNPDNDKNCKCIKKTLNPDQ